jgi:cell division cycle 20-like protein 1 (cofactor of APC complex)
MLCDLRDSVEAGATSDTAVASVKWMGRGSRVAVGTEVGTVQLWDAATQQRIRSLPGHHGKVGTLAWSGDVLASGGADGRIHLRDVRSPARPLRSVLRGHTGEVCGLAWSPDRQHLASGCSGAKLVVWDATATRSLRQCIGHTAAVKAIAWSPHQRGVFASGGGLEDPVIRFWCAQTPTAPAPRAAVNTAAQLCNLAWSAHSNELVSTHGYAHTGPQNQVMLWRYPTMARPTTLRRGHTSRVLFMAVSPGGRTIVTGAGGSDETLLFWNAFSGPPRAQHRGALSPKASPLCLFSQIR